MVRTFVVTVMVGQPPTGSRRSGGLESDGGGYFPPPSGPANGVSRALFGGNARSGKISATVSHRPRRGFFVGSAARLDLAVRVRAGVAGWSYLSSMTDTARITTTTSEPMPPVGDGVESFGARLARRSRQAQGLPPVIADPHVRERLRVLCGLPRPPATGVLGVPDELNAAGE